MDTKKASKYLDSMQIIEKSIFDSKDLEHPLDCLLEDYHPEQLKLLRIGVVNRSNNINEIQTIVVNGKVFMFEDELPTMTDEQYDKWHKTSIVYGGLRIGKVVITA